jgi:hypothetical protein
MYDHAGETKKRNVVVCNFKPLGYSIKMIKEALQQ